MSIFYVIFCLCVPLAFSVSNSLWLFGVDEVEIKNKFNLIISDLIEKGFLKTIISDLNLCRANNVLLGFINRFRYFGKKLTLREATGCNSNKLQVHKAIKDGSVSY